MNDFDTPNTRPGYCPECGIQADIWNVTHNTWECRLCNWTGTTPDQESKTKWRDEYAAL